LTDNDQKPVYETHDYSAVEKYIRVQNDRRDLSNQAIIKSAASSRLKYTALVIVSCGFAVLLVLYGVSFLSTERIRVIETNGHINKKDILGQSISDRLQELEVNYKKPLRPNLLNDTPDLKNIKKKPFDKTDVTTNYTVFKIVPSRIYQFGGVVTGHEYPNSKATYPESQFCYVTLKSEGVTKKHMYLANKDGRKKVEYFPYSLVSSYEISPSQFKSVQKYCQFKK
jgi:hypothetical protein